MKTLIIATVPTHHTSSALRKLNLKHYKQFPTGLHEAVEDFKTMTEALAYLKKRDTSEVRLEILTGQKREEYRTFNYLEY